MNWILVPAYEAARTLPDVLRRIPHPVRSRSTVLVIDDGSQDTTAEVARPLADLVLRNEVNLGYSRTQKRGITHALAQGATSVVLLHADGQYPPEALEEMLAPIESGSADVVLGSRVMDGGARRRGMPLYKYVANRALSWLENRAYGLELSEYHTGMMAYSRRALETLPYSAVSDTFHFDGEMAMLAGRRGLPIVEIPIQHRYGDEVSHLRPIRYGLQVVAIAAAVRTGLYDRWVEHRLQRQSAPDLATR